jgi:flagellar biosynthetic protein FliS
MDPDTLQRMKREYIENRVRSAHPVEIVTMLYQVAIDNLTSAIEHLRAGDHFARSAEVTKAEEAVHELLAALDHSVNAPFTHTLADLYRYALQRMVAGHGTRSETAFREALSVLTTLASAWYEIKVQMCQAPPAEEPSVQPPPEESRTPVNDPYAAYRLDQGAAGARDWSC